MTTWDGWQTETIQGVLRASRWIIGGSAGGLMAHYITAGIDNKMLFILMIALLIISLVTDLTMKYTLAKNTEEETTTDAKRPFCRRR